MTYFVARYTQGVYHSAVSGMGRNRGTLSHEAMSLRTAQRWAQQCNRDAEKNGEKERGVTYRVEES